jgi:hypothetical protein
MDRTPTTRNEPPEQPQKTAYLQALYGANRDRTGDLLLAKQALSQLSYGPKIPQYTPCGADFPIRVLSQDGDPEALES